MKKSKNNENSCQGSITTDDSIKVICIQVCEINNYKKLLYSVSYISYQNKMNRGKKAQGKKEI